MIIVELSEGPRSSMSDPFRAAVTMESMSISLEGRKGKRGKGKGRKGREKSGSV